MRDSWAGSTCCTGDLCIWSLAVSSWECKPPVSFFGNSGNGPGEVPGDVCNLRFLHRRYHRANATRSSRKTLSTVTQMIKVIRGDKFELEWVKSGALDVIGFWPFNPLFDTGTMEELGLVIHGGLH